MQALIRALGKNWYGNADILRAVIGGMTSGHAIKASQLWRIYCLTPHPDSLLMWAHYADKHQGVCLEFDATREFGMAYCVAYRDDLIVINPDLLREQEALAEAMVLTKSTEWEYEHEYRMLARDKAVDPKFPLTTEKNYYSLPAGALSAIVAGLTSNVLEIRALVDKWNPGLRNKTCGETPTSISSGHC